MVKVVPVEGPVKDNLLILFPEIAKTFASKFGESRSLTYLSATFSSRVCGLCTTPPTDIIVLSKKLDGKETDSLSTDGKYKLSVEFNVYESYIVSGEDNS